MESRADSSASERRFFAVSLETQLPPILGMPVKKPVTESDLADCLWSLLSAAGTNIIPAPADQPDPGSLVDQFADILHVARSFEIAPGIALTEGLWTRAVHIERWSGNPSLTLLETSALFNGLPRSRCITSVTLPAG